MTSVTAAEPGQRPRSWARSLDVLMLALLTLVAWQAISMWTKGIAVSTPWDTLAYLTDLLSQPMFWNHVAGTMWSFLLALAISTVAGLLLGLALGAWRIAAEVAEPLLMGFYTIPKVTLYPVVLLIFGLGTSAKVAFGIMHGLVPITLLTLGAVRNLSPTLLRTARSLRLPASRTMAWILLPACLPSIVSGFRISFSMCFLGVLVGEMFASQRGLGFLLVSGMAQHNIPLSTAVVVTILVIVIATNALLLRLSRRISHLNR